MGEKRDDSHPAGNGWACRCVVLVEPGCPRPDALLAGLRQRGAAVRLVSDAPTAMVELHEFQAQALIICHPEKSRSTESLLKAANFCHPQLVCWSYGTPAPGSSGNPATSGNSGDSGGSGSFHVGTPGNGRSEKLVPFAVRTAPLTRPPRFETANPPPRPSLSQRLVAPVESLSPMTQPAELSADELEMLLGPDFADSDPDETP